MSTGQVVDPDDCSKVATYVDLAGCASRVYLTKDEMNSAKCIKTDSSIVAMRGSDRSNEDKNTIMESDSSSAMLKVLFFAPHATALPLDMNLTSPGYIFPDDAVVRGSSLLFSGLIQHMVQKALVAVGVMSRYLYDVLNCFLLNYNV
jgi:hypothetical protein